MKKEKSTIYESQIEKFKTLWSLYKSNGHDPLYIIENPGALFSQSECDFVSGMVTIDPQEQKELLNFSDSKFKAEAKYAILKIKIFENENLPANKVIEMAKQRAQEAELKGLNSKEMAFIMGNTQLVNLMIKYEKEEKNLTKTK